MRGRVVAAVILTGVFVSDIPMTSLVAVMVMVSFATFDWHSIAPKTLRRIPAGEKYARRGKTVEITGLNGPSAHLHDRLSGELVAGH